MRDQTIRIPEMLITEIDFVRVDIRISLPKSGQTITYGLMEDARLFPLIPKLIRPEPDDFLGLHMWAKEQEERKMMIHALADKIAFAIFHAYEQKEVSTKSAPSEAGE